MRVSLSFAVPHKVSVTIGIFYFIAKHIADKSDNYCLQ